MLHNDRGEVSEGSLKMERCKPDYEAIIKKAKDKIEKTSNLKEALFAYLGTRHVKSQLAEMIGELVMEEREFRSIIEENIKRQEEDK